jgi:hypothetical protein
VSRAPFALRAPVGFAVFLVVLRGAQPWAGGDGAGGGAGEPGETLGLWGGVSPGAPAAFWGGCARQGSPVGLVAASTALGGLRAATSEGWGGWVGPPGLL